MVLGFQCRTSGADRVDPVVLGATAPLATADLHHVFTGLSKGHGEAGSEAAGSFQRPHASARCVLVHPRQKSVVSGAVGAVGAVAAHRTCSGIHHGEVDGV